MTPRRYSSSGTTFTTVNVPRGIYEHFELSAIRLPIELYRIRTLVERSERNGFQRGIARRTCTADDDLAKSRSDDIGTDDARRPGRLYQASHLGLSSRPQLSREQDRVLRMHDFFLRDDDDILKSLFRQLRLERIGLFRRFLDRPDPNLPSVRRGIDADKRGLARF